MTRHAKYARHAKETTPASGWTPSRNFLLEVNQRAFARWLNGMNGLSQEIAQFTQSRLQEDMAAWSALTSCNNPQDAFECQRRFAEKAAAGYLAEVTKLSAMMISLANEGLESRQRHTEATA